MTRRQLRRRSGTVSPEDVFPPPPAGETIPVLRMLAHPVEVDADGGETPADDTVWPYFIAVPMGSCMVQLILSPMKAEPDLTAHLM